MAFSPGVYTHSWSSDSRYLAIFMWTETFIYVYDRNTSWSLIKNQSVGYNNVRSAFYYA